MWYNNKNSKSNSNSTSNSNFTFSNTFEYNQLNFTKGILQLDENANLDFEEQEHIVILSIISIIILIIAKIFWIYALLK